MNARISRLPVVAAATTAVVSCGLLALAVARGWLGPDVGRGNTFCEAARAGLVKQPANTFSNLGFVVAGLLIAAGRGGKPIKTVMACIVVLLGPGSAAMHATQSAAGGGLDVLSMYLIAAFAFAYAVMRWRRAGWAAMGVTFAAGVAGCELAGLWHEPIPVVMYAGNVAFGLLLAAAAGLEIAIIRRGETTGRPGFAYASIGAMLVAFGVWNATQTWLCDPHSPVQGHAVWHLMTGLAAYLLYRYYDSENPRPPGG
ncbi:ceramidase domain-containing protein [Dactylosporangium sp. CS-033363]|uniref:ceramidase domain-containing protein n=1 Tax=Dactylosporangium sp. CS-033363 TaxID=3239935 RepID=UPI003D8B1E37